tara:strand:+ start:1179 stop:1451 length:273 start_codon:yes stop_codon:yes gene_type:complete
MTVSISETNKEKQKQIKVDDVIWAYRHNRNLLLDATDKYMTTDYPISEEKKKEVSEYRQKLRDCTKTFTVVEFDERHQLVQTFPTKPSWV